MKIALVRPNYKSHIITPPIGLGYLSSYLKKSGIETKIIDGLKENLSPSRLMRRILKFNPDAVGITCLTAFYQEVVVLARELAKIKSQPSSAVSILRFCRTARCWSRRPILSFAAKGKFRCLNWPKVNFATRVFGVYSLENLKSEQQEIIKASVVDNLDDLPFPDWEQIDPREYPRAPHGAVVRGFPVGVMVTSRGVPLSAPFAPLPDSATEPSDSEHRKMSLPKSII